MKKVLSAFIAIAAMTFVSCGNKNPQVIIVKDTVVVEKNNAAPAPVAEKPAAEKPAPAPKPKAEPKGPSQLAAQADPVPQYVDREHWSGAIGGRYKINMYINENTGEFWYNYTKYPNGRLWLRVCESGGGHLSLIETNEDGVDTGMFDGYISGNKYTGTFTNFQHNKSYSFSLTRR